MPIFKLQDRKALKIEKRNIVEKEIQQLFEENLEELLGIKFICTEYPTNEGRIDSLGIDQNGKPVIIEYKRNQNDNVINQATWYLEWLLDYKEKFENLVKEKLPGHNLTIDWTDPRVICVAESYNKFDLGLVKFLPFTIQLLKFRLYDDLLSFDSENIQKGIKLGSNSKQAVDEQNKPVREYGKEYLITDLFAENWKESRNLYEQINENILKLDSNIEVKINKLYISYKIENIICEIIPQSKGLWVHITMPVDKIKRNKIELHDVSQRGHWGTGETKFRIENKEDIDLALDYIKQSYEYSL
jgi:predicted transport protein